MGWTAIILNGLIALFTGTSAWVAWRQWRGEIQVEWAHTWVNFYKKSIPPHIEVTLTVRNYRKAAISCMVAEAPKGAVSNITVGSATAKKHESWDANQTPLSMDVVPGGSATNVLFVFPDWEALAASRSARWFRRSSAALRIQISIASKARRRAVTKHRTTIAISSDDIEKNAKMVESQRA